MAGFGEPKLLVGEPDVPQRVEHPAAATARLLRLARHETNANLESWKQEPSFVRENYTLLEKCLYYSVLGSVHPKPSKSLTRAWARSRRRA